MSYSIALLGCWLFLLLIAQRKFFHIALIGFPGVVMHEFMHLVIGIIFFAKPASLNLVPRRIGNKWRFGSISFIGLTLFNSAPVAYAPLLLLGIAWILFHHWMVPLILAEHYSLWVLSGYLIACAMFYSLPSTTDIKVGGFSTLFWGAIILAGWWFWNGSLLMH
jgi:hypothetical protein